MRATLHSDHPLPGIRGLLLGLSLALAAGLALDTAFAESNPKSGFRIYRERNAQGEEVLHITNLDEDGRRIGGEIEQGATPDAAAYRCQSDEAIPEAPSPVIVNIYTMAPPEAGPDDYGEHDGTRFWPSSYGYARFPAGYWPQACRIHRHAGLPQGFFGRPRIIDTRPYSRATASQRNRASFQKN